MVKDVVYMNLGIKAVAVEAAICNLAKREVGKSEWLQNLTCGSELDYIGAYLVSIPA